MFECEVGCFDKEEVCLNKDIDDEVVGLKAD